MLEVLVLCSTLFLSVVGIVTFIEKVLGVENTKKESEIQIEELKTRIKKD